MENVEKIKPTGLFTNYIYKTIPLAFDESMSYYETLCGLLSYLRDTVIPAVDNNANAIIEVQTKIIELQDYVDHYFDNLDVQEEINNKLDEMAEQGTLTDIIAQYLQLAGVLAYDTKTAMKSAENLANGSICKTLGNTSYKDGQGNFYKVREVINTDDIDDENIIALSDENLVAEKVPDKIINITSNMTSSQIIGLIELDIPKLVVFEKASYTLTDVIHVPNNTIIDLNGSTLIFDIEGEANAIFGYKFDDTFTGYTGNEFTIKNGTIDHGAVCLMHNINCKIENIEFTGDIDTWHIIQIAGSKDISIKDCTFNGVEKADESDESNYLTHEIINIDPCIYGAQPYMEEDSPMYDNTINEGIYIENNIFNKGDDTDTKCYVCIGSHASVDNYPIYSKNIVIKNNQFNYALYSCMSFIEIQDVKILDNYFNGYGGRSAVTFLMTRVTNKNFEIKNNTTENICEFIHNASAVTDYYNENFVIDGNNIKNRLAIPNADATFFMVNSKNVVISNNNVNTDGIIVALTNYCYDCVITNNTFKTTVTNNNIIKLYGTGTGNKVIGNNIEGLTNTNYCMATYIQDDYVIAYNNYSNEQLFLETAKVTKNVFCNNAIYDLTDLTNATTGSDITPKGTLSNFKALKVLLGGGTNCTVVDLLPFLHNGMYIDSRVMSASYVNDNNSFGYIKLTTDVENNKLAYTSSSLGVRRIYGIS